MRAFVGNDQGASGADTKVADAANTADTPVANTGDATDTADTGNDGSVATTPEPAPKAATQPEPAKVDTTIVHLFVRGGVPADLPDVEGVALTDDESNADLIWDRTDHTVNHRIGGLVAQDVTDDGIAAILSKWSALAFIKAHIGEDPVSLSTPSGNQTYNRGEIVQLAMDGARFPYLTLFNLPPDGRVEFFIPANDKETNFDWRGQHMSERFRVDQPPFGAEHLVAILTPQPALALHEALRSMSVASQAIAGWRRPCAPHLPNTPFQAGVVGIYTNGGT